SGRIPRESASAPGKVDGGNNGNGALPLDKQPIGNDNAAPNTVSRETPNSGTSSPRPVDAKGTVEKPTPVIVDTPKNPAPVPVEEEKPERNRLGRLFESAGGSSNSGSSNNGNGSSSSPRTSSPEPQRSEPRYNPPAPRPEPVSRPEPVHHTPAPAPTPRATPAPAPVSKPSLGGRGGK
ncbi:MAG: hypothetical protein HYZ43_12125, partial [Flavobacteriia bacterium]|nr:hypothetical protein [Flavobacteriia bacterium]